MIPENDPPKKILKLKTDGLKQSSFDSPFEPSQEEQVSRPRDTILLSEIDPRFYIGSHYPRFHR
jgi:hypothetical protein